MSAFLGFGTALPEHVVTPEESLLALSGVFPRLRGVVPTETVTRRTAQPLSRVMEARSLDESMALYAEHAPRLAVAAARSALDSAQVRAQDVDLVISVSCTGYLVPSLDVRLARELGLRPDVVRLPITELGCSGGAAALAAAHRHLAAYPFDRVLVVAVEICSLSFRPGDRSLDNLTASLVFGDGAAAAVLTGDAGGPEQALRILATGEQVVPSSEKLLGFDLGSEGFRIVLDRSLPRLIRSTLGEVVAGFERRHGVPRRRFHVVHAGGPRIFDAVEAALCLDPDDLTASRQVFREFGNLSSASILFGLAGLEPDIQGDGLAIAFGPGVTVALAHLRRGFGTAVAA
ncbi:MAG: type III polyketide synthase [Candidatus Dormibacteraeota bacterium]|nr:type III polyketide synthase [Candidatus Dormibacteraeota bacterium]